MYKEDTTIKLDEQEVSSEEVMTKFDKESKFRRLSGTPAKIVFVIAVAWSVFQLSFHPAKGPPRGSCNGSGLPALSDERKAER